MKRKSLIIGILIAVFSTWLIPDAAAQRHRYRPHHRYYHGHAPRGYYRSHVYVAPPPPRVVVVPHYGYRRGYYRPHRYSRSKYYARPHHYHGHRSYHRGRGHWR